MLKTAIEKKDSLPSKDKLYLWEVVSQNKHSRVKEITNGIFEVLKDNKFQPIILFLTSKIKKIQTIKKENSPHTFTSLKVILKLVLTQKIKWSQIKHILPRNIKEQRKSKICRWTWMKIDYTKP